MINLSLRNIILITGISMIGTLLVKVISIKYDIPVVKEISNA
jgi:hypothetical protein